jgi:hypothetical protein
MTVDDDDNVIEMIRPGDAIGVEGRGGRPGREPESETGDTLPLPGDEYVACGRVSNKPQLMLCFILRDQSYELFPYGDLVRVRLAAPSTPGAGRVIRMRFAGDGVMDVKIEGRNLLELVHNLRRHRIPWLRETPTDRTFAAPRAVVITRIAIGLAEGRW